MPNPVGSLAPTDGSPVPDDKMFVLDMFPYPGGRRLARRPSRGLHATDIVAATSGCAAITCCTRWAGTPSACPPSSTPSRPAPIPRTTTQANIQTFRRQIKSLGFSYDWDREVDTTDPEYYKWTQWIFLQIYDTWYDLDLARTRLASGQRSRRIAVRSHANSRWRRD